MRSGWNEVRLGEVLALDLDTVKVEPEADYALAGVFSFGRGLFARQPLRGAATSYKQLNRLRSGQLVMSKLKAWEGAVAVVDDQFDGFVLSPEFPTFTITGALEASYLALVCSHPAFWEQLQLESRGVGGRRERVHPRRLLEVRVKIPSLDAQRRVVDVVASVAALETSSEAVFRAASTAGAAARQEHFAGAGTVPASAFFDIAIGRQRAPKHASGEHLRPYLRAANVKDGRLALTDVKRMNFTPAEQVKYQLLPKDVLVSEGCGSLQQLGAPAQWTGELNGVVCFQNTLLRVRGVEDRSLSDYAYQWARWCFESGRFAAVASGTNIFHIGVDRARAIPVPDIGLNAQAELVGRVDVLDRVAARAHVMSVRAGVLRRALLDDLLTGRHEIPDSYDALLEAAS